MDGPIMRQVWIGSNTSINILRVTLRAFIGCLLSTVMKAIYRQNSTITVNRTPLLLSVCLRIHLIYSSHWILPCIRL
ncbi:hypothetical protein CCHR01_17511 [Colletotrichum chrysophilum]|uniref:Uncharacterized protein n=1 Tax=Colletotrichum chrysophilum TaxID=1836956 RepID=A0AAD9A3G4_9PEZI|nr:hypothetical protein CCHR01_17511 [Colletotrichum chrysophilum]